MELSEDQTGRQISLAGRPCRIVSTVPSQTELLFDLGLEKEVAGITAYCVHPPHWLKEKMIIGGTKDLQLEKIRRLQPDLIIGNKEENVKEQIEDLARDFNVWLSDVTTVESAINMISSIGEITGTVYKANELIAAIKTQRKQLKNPAIQKTAAYFIWKDPYMVAGSDTFINAMMEESGLINCFGHLQARYPQISVKDLQNLNPDLILLSSEPYPFKTKDLHQIAEFCPDARVRIVDGEMYSWYGSRMLKGLKYLPSVEQ